MQHQARLHPVVIAAVFVLAVGSGHLVEDYLHGVHTGFGLSEPVGMILAIVYYALFTTLIVLAARDQRAGYIGLLAMGIFLALAEIVYHGPQIVFEWPYRNGLFSKGLEMAVMAGSVVMAGLAARLLSRRSVVR
jgi:hypothetical protein